MNNLKPFLFAAAILGLTACPAWAQSGNTGTASGSAATTSAKPTTAKHHKTSGHKGKTYHDGWEATGSSKGKGKNGGFPDDWSQQGQPSSASTGGKGKGKHGGAPDDWSAQGQSASTGKSGKGKPKPKPKTATDDWEASQPK